MACRSINTPYRFDKQANDGILTHFHFSLTGVEGPAQTVHDLLCPLGAHIKEWDMKASGPPVVTVPQAPGPPVFSRPGLADSWLPSPPTSLQVDNLNGTLPNSTATCLPKLEEYDVSRNKIVGTIPPQVRVGQGAAAGCHAGCPACQAGLLTAPPSPPVDPPLLGLQLGDMPVVNQFKVQGNKLTGTLPPEFSKLKLLEWLRVFGE